MANSKELVRAAVEQYARKGLNAEGFFTQSLDGNVLSVAYVAHQGKNTTTVLNLLVRFVADFIVIERDQNDPPLVETLLQAGIPRSQIIAAYAGEPVPDVVQ